MGCATSNPAESDLGDSEFGSLDEPEHEESPGVASGPFGWELTQEGFSAVQLNSSTRAAFEPGVVRLGTLASSREEQIQLRTTGWGREGWLEPVASKRPVLGDCSEMAQDGLCHR